MVIIGKWDVVDPIIVIGETHHQKSKEWHSTTMMSDKKYGITIVLAMSGPRDWIALAIVIRILVSEVNKI